MTCRLLPGGGINTTRCNGRGGGQPVSLNKSGMDKQRGEQDQGERLPGSGCALASRPHAKIHPTENPRTGRCQYQEDHSGRERWGNRGDRGKCDRRTPQGLTGSWAQSKGGTGGGNKSQERRHMQACRAGRRDVRRRLTGGGCGWCPGGRSFAPREEVRSGCYIYRGIRLWKASDGGGSRMGGRTRKIQKWLEQMGREGQI